MLIVEFSASESAIDKVVSNREPSATSEFEEYNKYTNLN